MFNRNFVRLFAISSFIFAFLFHTNSANAQVVCDNFPITTCNVPPGVGVPFTIQDNNLVATGQAGEPSAWASPKSLWFSFTPPTTGVYYVTTKGTNPNNTLVFDTFIALYRGSNTTFSALNLVASNNDWGSPCTLFTATALGTEHPKSSCLIGTLVAGEKSYIKVDSNLGGAGGLFLVNVDLLQAVTAANASISGKVLTSQGRGIRNVGVSITNLQTGETRNTITTSFGNYTFDDLPSGNQYFISITGKRYNFSPSSQTINLTESLNGINFVGDLR